MAPTRGGHQTACHAGILKSPESGVAVETDAHGARQHYVDVAIAIEITEGRVLRHLTRGAAETSSVRDLGERAVEIVAVQTI